MTTTSACRRRYRCRGRVDWSAYAVDHAIPKWRDGIHYSPEGYQSRAAFYVAAGSGHPAVERYVLS